MLFKIANDASKNNKKYDGKKKLHLGSVIANMIHMTINSKVPAVKHSRSGILFP